MWSSDRALAPLPSTTGIALADRGLGCVPVGGGPVIGPCFLEPLQRQFVLNCYHANVAAAHAEYLTAIGGIKVEELIKKEPDQFNLLLEAFLDVITLAIGASVRTALRRLMAGGDDVTAIISDQQRLLNELSTVTDTGIVAVLTGSAARVRNNVKDEPEHGRATSEKTASVSFLDLLSAQAAVRYHHLAVSSPAGMSDAQLLVLYRAFEPWNGHTSGHYTQYLRTKLERFKQSGLSSMGIRPNRNHLRVITGAGGPDADSYWEIATQAFWVNTPVGRRLALYRRGHVALPSSVPVGLTGGSRPATPAEKKELEREELEARPFRFFQYVPDEFTQAAVQMHIARWGAEPAEHAFGVREFKALGLVK